MVSCFTVQAMSNDVTSVIIVTVIINWKELLSIYKVYACYFFLREKNKSWNDFSRLLFEFFLQRGVAVRFSDTLLEETGWLWNFFHSGIAQFGDPRVGQLGQEKKAAKVFKNGQESPGDNTINEPVLRHIRKLVCFCAQSEVSIYRAAFLIS